MCPARRTGVSTLKTMSIFLAATPESHYSRYNVYWLISGERRGLRPADLEGAVQTSLTSTAPAFRSKIKLEKNLLHTRLQESPPKAVPPEDPHTWYDNRTHWLWFGVQNGSIQNTENKAARDFPIYDPAKSFDFARIDVALQGETPVEHEAVVMFNGLLIGRAQEGWFEQEPLQMGKTMRMEHLIDPVNGLNTLEITRVDDNGDDKRDQDVNNVDLYPYHMYVDSLEIEYTRLYRAVSDSLFASSPPSNKPLAERQLRTIQYDVSDFLNPNIAVYEHNGLALTARLRNVETRSAPLDQEGRARLSAIQAAQGKNAAAARPNLRRPFSDARQQGLGLHRRIGRRRRSARSAGAGHTLQPERPCERRRLDHSLPFAV